MAVVLIDVDPSYYDQPEKYLPKAQKIMDKHKLDWPNAIASKGFHDTALAFNVSGYGNIVVDARGIVRGVNAHGKQLEQLIETIVEGNKGEKAQ